MSATNLPAESVAIDESWMLHALELGRRGIALCSPNPMVGCVILDAEGKLAGEGWHEYERRDHAEVIAIRAAGKRAHGGTAYVTLEPCNHTGRTGPCSEALIDAGVMRVVAATTDPNPRVVGHGLERLRQAGVAVEVGICSGAARRLNEGFARWIVSRRPFVLMKVATTLDGKIAPTPRLQEHGVFKVHEPFWITGEASRAQVQQMRWAADAVLTGVDTVIADNPLLTDRSGNLRRRPLLRAVLDSSLRLPIDSNLVKSAANGGSGELVVFTVSQDAARIRALTSRGVRVEVLEADNGTAQPSQVPLRRMLERLGSEGILTLLTETGSKLNTALLAAELVDRLTVFSSPQIMGSDAVSAFRALRLPLRLDAPESERYGQDVCISGLLRNPWTGPQSPNLR